MEKKYTEMKSSAIPLPKITNVNRLMNFLRINILNYTNYTLNIHTSKE